MLEPQKSNFCQWIVCFTREVTATGGIVLADLSDKMVVFIRHGSQLVRVATCRVIKTENGTECKELKTKESG